MKNIALIGFMGTGKTSVGKKLAQQLGYNFIDTDQEVEHIMGLPVSEIFKRFGETRFRSEETLALKRILETEGQVIATGGGIVLKAENVALLKENAFIAGLHATPEEIHRRVEGRSTRPLLKGGDLMSRIQQLLAERKDAYNCANLAVDTTELSQQQVATKIATAYQKHQLYQPEMVQVELGDNSYEIVIGAGNLPYLGQELSELAERFGWGRQVMVISNPTVEALYGQQVLTSLAEAGFAPFLALMQDGEQYKTMETAMQLFDQALDQGLDRKSLIVALGGGVVGDMAGFVAATYMRGIPFVQVPTTLLAQVDSSVGGKVAVNHPRGKNIIGAFYQPKLVWADVNVLKTLPPEELKAGLAEVIKYGLIWDGKFFSYLEQRNREILNLNRADLQEIIKQSCTIKAQVVAVDERETGLRAILNLGHTFGHALESLTNYRKYRHGEAVAIGMSLACQVALEMGLLTKDEVGQVNLLIGSYGLPVEDREVPANDIMQSMYHDKKAESGKIKYVIPEAIGRVRITSEIPESTVLKVLSHID